MGSLSIWHWLVVLVIVVLIFGTSKLKNMGKEDRRHCSHYDPRKLSNGKHKNGNGSCFAVGFQNASL